MSQRTGAAVEQIVTPGKQNSQAEIAANTEPIEVLDDNHIEYRAPHSG